MTIARSEALEPLLKPREVAGILNVTPDTVLDMAQDGRLPSLKLGAGPNAPVRFRRGDITQWLNAAYRQGRDS